MKKTIKNFFMKKRFKLLKNKKGFSLIEIMVAVGVMGIITAFAVPQYRSYQRTARYGVMRSMLAIPHRVVEIEESQAGNLDNVNGGFLWARVKSKARGSFGTPTFDKTGSNWCFLIVGSTGTQYDGYQGCIDNDGDVMIGGSNVPCGQGESIRAKASGATVCTNNGCPSGCKIVGSHTACGSITAGTSESKKCQPDSNETFTRTLTCTSGACGS